ncbi:MAG: hypothetical protein JW934_23090 [Anaerolineae bacterium]|nr:hypothetical protein [Anaerolineae bacterium]
MEKRVSMKNQDSLQSTGCAFVVRYGATRFFLGIADAIDSFDERCRHPSNPGAFVAQVTSSQSCTVNLTL